LWMMLRRQAGLVVLLMSELGKESVGWIFKTEKKSYMPLIMPVYA
jgi:hypothetical protein